ncbi:hypothetical protein GDO86_000870 [Hymenochirus boettgeri]|uniref:Heparan-alpha-glucosaminide N-acetyltransferase catalytic domain-containing protein n=1 Tax=Hymenochirus boettgeri TaxID=247094 RepID=A0A8T2KBA6_9PIPI|nr:hypothetical protein GDO86_000870 [Hymenochirus boettgeri]
MQNTQQQQSATKVESREDMKGSVWPSPLSAHCFTIIITFSLTLLCAITSSSINSLSTRSVLKRPAHLKMDQAVLLIKNALHFKRFVVYWRSDQCYQCLYQNLVEMDAAEENGQPVAFIVDTQHPLSLQLNDTSGTKELCLIHYHFREFGNYSLWVKSNISNNEDVMCEIIINQNPAYTYFPILIAVLTYLGFFILVYAGMFLFRLNVVQNWLINKMNPVETDRLINSDLGSPNRLDLSCQENFSENLNSASQRLRSLDTFRGLALTIMVFVNYGGGGYWFFRHQSWNGLTLADLVFPWFVFIMGTSIYLSLNAMLRKGISRWKLSGKVLWRSIQLFLIGLFVINPNYCRGPLSWSEIRILGVLQRLSLTYLVVSALEIIFAKPIPDTLPQNQTFFVLRDVFLYWPQWIVILSLEMAWLCLTLLLKVPGCPLGYLGPGGIGDFGKFPNCTGGAAGFIDRLILGGDHIYQHPSSNVIYKTTMPYDPEGLLGTINSVVIAFFGLQAGKILVFHKAQHKHVLCKFFMWSIIMGAVSAILTRCSTNEGFIPVNKNLWSISYITTLSCFAFLLLMLMYFLVDVKKIWSGAPFYYPGKYLI